MYRLLSLAIERRWRTVPRLLLLLEVRVRVRVSVEVLGVRGKGGWGFEGVAVVELRGGGKVAREARSDDSELAWVLAGDLGEKHGGF